MQKKAFDNTQHLLIITKKKNVKKTKKNPQKKKNSKIDERELENRQFSSDKFGESELKNIAFLKNIQNLLELVK